MMKTIVVSDTNIFIDLVKLDLLGDLFALPWDVHTTDFVISELTDPVQKAAVTAFIKRNKLTIGRLSSEEVGKIVQRSSETGGKISITDFSVCLYSKKNGYTLLTGDRNLRKIAINESIAVHGIHVRIGIVFGSRIKFYSMIREYEGELLAVAFSQ